MGRRPSLPSSQRAAIAAVMNRRRELVRAIKSHGRQTKAAARLREQRRGLPTLKDMAAKLGVSFATIGRAGRGHKFRNLHPKDLHRESTT